MSKTSKKELTCPVCEGKKVKVFCQSDGFVFAKCGICDLLYLVNAPSKQSLNKFYFYEDEDSLEEKLCQSNPLLDFFLRNPTLKKAEAIWGNYVNKSRAGSVVKNAKEGRTILDVGCGPGIFLEEMKRRGWGVFGNELGDKLVSMAKDKVGKGRIFKGELQDLENALSDKKVDVISMWHVFEHLHETGKALESANKILGKNGKLIIEVPHSKSINLQLFKSCWTLLMAPQHLHFWSEKSLDIILSNYGFKIIIIEYPPHFPFIFSSSTVKKYKAAFLILPIPMIISVFIALISSLIKRGDVIRVYAAKK